MSCYAYRLAPCDLGDPGWGDPWFPHGAFVASLALWYGLVIFWVLPSVFAAIPCRDDTMLSSLAIQCYHLLHELAYELAPVTPCFCGFGLCWVFLVCFALVGLF